MILDNVNVEIELLVILLDVHRSSIFAMDSVYINDK